MFCFGKQLVSNGSWDCMTIKPPQLGSNAVTSRSVARDMPAT